MYTPTIYTTSIYIFCTADGCSQGSCALVLAEQGVGCGQLQIAVCSCLSGVSLVQVEVYFFPSGLDAKTITGSRHKSFLTPKQDDRFLAALYFSCVGELGLQARSCVEGSDLKKLNCEVIVLRRHTRQPAELSCSPHMSAERPMPPSTHCVLQAACATVTLAGQGGTERRATLPHGAEVEPLRLHGHLLKGSALPMCLFTRPDSCLITSYVLGQSGK